MYARLYSLPKRSFFLFGPRGTGKTTWLKTVLKDALWFDLLRLQTVLDLKRRPEHFRIQIEALPPKSWIVIDEIQRMPELLNEVHALLTDYPHHYQFAMSGSSARKLRRMDVNLLAGRAFNRLFFPLCGKEMNYDYNPESLLQFGMLPMVRAESEHAQDTLEAYVSNYIREEIQQEALVKDLGSFARFLEIVALMNGQIVNVSSIARDAGVARPTVQGYFQALVDTLVGFWLPSWRRKIRVKETALSKFYFFDPGVVRALASRLREPMEEIERGFLFETLVLHELRTWMALRQTDGKLSFWRTPSGKEVDFIWERGPRAVGIEVKSSIHWRNEYSQTLKELHHSKILHRTYGVYLGKEVLRDGPVKVLSLIEFQKALAEGEIIG